MEKIEQKQSILDAKNDNLKNLKRQYEGLVGKSYGKLEAIMNKIEDLKEKRL